MLASANTDERTWDDVGHGRLRPTEVNKHLAFGGGAHRCLGSHLARMELRVALEEWHAAVPEYSLGTAWSCSTRRACARSRTSSSSGDRPRDSRHLRADRLNGNDHVGEARMLINGKLVEAEGGGTFDNINPATEEVLGPGRRRHRRRHGRGHRARRGEAFDTTTGRPTTSFRKECLHQLQAAIESEQEELRAELVAEVGCPVLTTYGPQLDAPLREALLWPAEMIEEFPWSRRSGRRTPSAWA
jgi:hypothetical protein